MKHEMLWIDGPAGRLETILLPPQAPARGVAVINHPNPLQGGTHTNKVVQTAAKALSALGFHCYLPNLRGVGNSEGTHDYGAGEADDCIAVIDFAKAQHPDLRQLAIAGFSFGGYVALFAAQQRKPDLLLLMGAALHHYERREPAAPDPAKTLVLHGAEDEIVPVRQALAWASAQDIPVLTFADTTHFFHGKLVPLRDTVLRFAPAILG